MSGLSIGLARIRHDRGWHIFLIIWLGQLVSLLGTGMTRFALLIWAYQQTGAATTVALLGFFSFIPFVVLGPVAGTVVDRVNRRTVMIAADAGAGLLTVLLWLLYRQDTLAIWHMYAVALLAGTFEAFQSPAYSAATTMLQRLRLPRPRWRQHRGHSASDVAARATVSWH